MADDPTLIFLHIQKTAGITLNSLLTHYFAREESYTTYPTARYPEGSLDGFRALSEERRARLRLVSGHLGYGLHEWLPRPGIYITILRDPVERVLSHYYHERRDPRNPLHDKIQAGMGVAEYVRYYAEAGDMDNLQTRMIAGNWDKRGFGPCTPAMLATAKQNLRDHFAVVGLTEQFDAFYLLLRRTFGWPSVYHTPKNVTKNRPRADAVPPETVDVVKQYNRFDGDLYRYAQELFAAQVRQAGLSFWVELALSRLHRRLEYAYWEVRKRSLRVYLRNRLDFITEKHI